MGLDFDGLSITFQAYFTVVRAVYIATVISSAIHSLIMSFNDNSKYWNLMEHSSGLHMMLKYLSGSRF